MIILKIIFIIVFVIFASIDLALSVFVSRYRDGDEFKDFQEFIRRHKK